MLETISIIWKYKYGRKKTMEDKIRVLVSEETVSPAAEAPKARRRKTAGDA